MQNGLFRIAASLALIGAGQAQAATAQRAAPCISREEMRGMVAYFLPTVVNSVIKTCKPHLAADSYLSARASNLVTALEPGKANAWPMAKVAFMKLGGAGKADQDFANLPDEAIRPLMDAIVETKVAPEIKPANCADISRVMATVEPLPADNMVAFFTEIFALFMRDENKKSVCPAV